MDNLEEGKFLEKYNLTRLSQEEIENMQRQITVETVIQKLPTRWLHR